MSHTDKDAPYWVRAQRHHEETGRSSVHHSLHCLDYDGFMRPRDWILKRVDRETAAEQGWSLAPGWSDFTTSSHVYVRVPHGPFECDADHGGGRCHRYIEYGDYGYTRWYGGLSGPDRERRHHWYFGPERAAVRDSLRDAAREFNGRVRHCGDAEAAEDWEPQAEFPVRQSRGSTWHGGWWD